MSRAPEPRRPAPILPADAPVRPDRVVVIARIVVAFFAFAAIGHAFHLGAHL